MARRKKDAETIDQGPPKKSKKLDLVALGRSIGRKYGYGESSVQVSAQMAPEGYLSTGLELLDAKALCGCGLPWACFTHIWGDTQSGKTALGMKLIAGFHQVVPDGAALLVDAELAHNPEFAAKIGVDGDRLLPISLPGRSGEEYLEATLYAIQEWASVYGRKKIFVLVDSIAALLPKVWLEVKEDKDRKVGAQATMMAKYLPKLRSLTTSAGAIVVFLNQVRCKIGTMFGCPEQPPGGKATGHNMDVSMRFREDGKVKLSKDSKEILGMDISVKVDKSRFFPPYRTSRFRVHYWGHVSDEEFLVDDLLFAGILKPNGSWYSYQGNNLGQGKQAVIAALRGNPRLRGELFRELRAIWEARPAELRAAYFGGGDGQS